MKQNLGVVYCVEEHRGEPVRDIKKKSKGDPKENLYEHLKSQENWKENLDKKLNY